MAKNVIFCADGTWNSPNQDENADQSADPTNVYKLFLWLAGTDSPHSLRCADEQERQLHDGAQLTQIAKYLHGVGDSRNPVVKILGGAFGAGVIARIVRGYTFVSRNYEPGDHIHIVGFSRGAYTARALAGLIGSQGLLGKHIDDPQEAYRCGAEAWYRYRKATLKSGASLDHLSEIAADLPAFFRSGSLADSDLVAVDSIRSVAVWDTVGALGFPAYAANGERIDAYKFADTVLSAKVQLGVHAIARDEQRVDFTPTLWNAGANVTQLIFPGAHGDVGGGYPMSNGESGLSDGALQWLVDRLRAAGVLFAASSDYPVTPRADATAHQPWIHQPWSLIPDLRLRRRTFPAGLPEDASVAARMAAGPVRADPSVKPAPYV